jgi:hypothetical protein
VAKLHLVVRLSLGLASLTLGGVCLGNALAEGGGIMLPVGVLTIALGGLTTLGVVRPLLRLAFEREPPNECSQPDTPPPR